MESQSKALDMSPSKNKVLSPVFLCFLPFLYYIDYARKLYRHVGFPRMHDFSFEILINWISTMTLADWKFWIGWIIYPSLYAIYVFFLYRYADKIENAVNEPFKKLLPIILPIVFTVVIIANAAIGGGNSNSMIMTKLGWCWAIGLVLFATKVFNVKNLSNN